MNDTKRFTLTQFKNSTKGEEFYPSKRNLKLRKNRTVQYKTEGDEFVDRGGQSNMERI